MRVHLNKKRTVVLFMRKHARSRVSFKEWLSRVKYAEWDIPQDMVDTFGNNNIDLLGSYKGKNSNRVVFDVAGNNYRILCYYQFGTKYVRLYIKWIGTHAEYDKLCDANEQYTINEY